MDPRCPVVLFLGKTHTREWCTKRTVHGNLDISVQNSRLCRVNHDCRELMSRKGESESYMPLLACAGKAGATHVRQKSTHPQRLNVP